LRQPATAPFTLAVPKRTQVVSAGVFVPDENNRAVVLYAEAPLVSSISSLTVTDEPQGEATPSGPRFSRVSGAPQD